MKLHFQAFLVEKFAELPRFSFWSLLWLPVSTSHSAQSHGAAMDWITFDQQTSASDPFNGRAAFYLTNYRTYVALCWAYDPFSFLVLLKLWMNGRLLTQINDLRLSILSNKWFKAVNSDPIEWLKTVKIDPNKMLQAVNLDLNDLH